MAHELSHYRSYLVRMWQENLPEQPGVVVWHAEAEHIQTGQRYHFLNHNELYVFLSRQHQSGEPHEHSTVDI